MLILMLTDAASLADDVFEVNDVDPGGKKFTKGTTLPACMYVLV